MKPAVSAPVTHAMESTSTETVSDRPEKIVKFISDDEVRKENQLAKQYDQDLVLSIGAEDRVKSWSSVGMEMHRYPASIRALCLEERYTTPMVVAIGPYYHFQDHLKPAEKMKHVAASQLVREAWTVGHMYDQVAAVASEFYQFYDMDVIASFPKTDFLRMMFHDACFLAQYMLFMSDFIGFEFKVDPSLHNFFYSNENEIFHDILLLQNQIPWPVVQTILDLTHETPENFIYPLKRYLKHLKGPKERTPLIGDNYQPHHLLSFLRSSIVGTSNTKTTAEPQTYVDEQASLSVSADELAEIGMKLKAKENSYLIHMGTKTKGPFLGELFLAPLHLDDARASCLINMAALELCTTPNFRDAHEEDSAVCSYLLLLATLVTREEDVQKLRRQHILLGAGLANKAVLNFFTRLHSIRLGSSYVRTMIQIQHYKSKRWMWIQFYSFCYRNKETLTTVVPIFSALVGILVSIIKFRGSA